MEKPLSIKHSQTARLYSQKGRLSDTCQHSTLLAHLSESVGKDHAPLPREGDHSPLILAGGRHPSP